MSEQVLRRRDIAPNVSTFTGGPGELVVDLTNNRVTVHDGQTAGGWPAAKLSEVQQALQGASSNAAAIAAETQRAEAAEAVLGSSLAAKANASDLASALTVASALYPPERPGDGIGFYTASLSPTVTAANQFPSASLATVSVDTEGAVINVAPQSYLFTKEFYPTEPGRVYAARVAFAITTSGLTTDGVTFGLAYFDANKTFLGTTALTAFSGLSVLSGRQNQQFLVTRNAPPATGQTALNPATRYARLFVQNTGVFQQVGVEVMQWLDYTGLILLAGSGITNADVQNLQNQITTETSRAEAAEAASATGSVSIKDANYAAAVADLGATYETLTATRTLTLPPRASMPFAKPFPVMDESGNASVATSIVVVAASGDTINGSASNTLTIATAYGIVTPRAGATTWIFG